MSAVVQVTILGDDTSLKKALVSSEESLAAFSKAAKTAGDNMQSAGRTLTHGITVPVVAAGAAAVKMAYDFQQNVQKVINLSSNFGQTAAQVSKTVLSVSSATGQSASDLANAYYKVAAAGYTGATAQQILATGAKMAAVGMGDSATTTDALIGVINVYGEKNMSAAKAADILTATIQNSKFAAADLAPVLGRVLPVAANLGVSFQDLGGDLAALSHTGLGADASVTGLTALFSNLIASTKGTGNAAKEMKALGLSAKGLMQDLGTQGTIATLDEIKTKLVAAGGAAQYSTAQWQDLASQMGMSLDDVKAKFGKIDMGKLQMLFPNKKAFLTFLGLTDENNVAAQAAAKNVGQTVVGTLQRVFGQWSASDAGKMTLAINELKNGLIELGDKLLPKVAAAVSDVVNWWTKLSDVQKGNIEHWALLAAEIGPVLLVMGKVVSAVGALTKVMDANPFVLVGAALAMLYINSTNFRNVVNSVLGVVAPFIGDAHALGAALAAVAAVITGRLLVSVGTHLYKALADVASKMLVARGAAAALAAEEAALGVASGAAAAGGIAKLTMGIGGLISSPGGMVAAAGAAGFLGFKLGEWLDDKIQGTTTAIQNMTQAASFQSDQVQGLDTAITTLGGSMEATIAINDALNGHMITYSATTGAVAAMQSGLTAHLGDVIQAMKDAGYTSDQTKAALENLGYTVQQANTIVASFSTLSAQQQFADLGNSANAAGQAALDALQTISDQQYHAAGFYGPGPIVGAGTSAPTSTYSPVAQPSPSGGAGSSGGGSPAGGGGSSGSKGSAAAAKAAAKSALAAAKLAAAEATAATNGQPLLNLEGWLMGGLQNTGKDGPVTKAAKALAADIKKNYTVKGGTVPQAAQDAQAALAQLAQQASSFNSSFQSKLSSGADFVSVFKGTGAGAGDIKAYLGQQISGLKRLGSDLTILKGRGLPPAVLTMLANAGIDGVDQADSLVNANSTDFAAIIGLGNQITGLSQSIANSTESAIFAPPSAQTAALANGSTSKTAKNKAGHDITVTVNNADAKKIAKTIALTLQNAS